MLRNRTAALVLAGCLGAIAVSGCSADSESDVTAATSAGGMAAPAAAPEKAVPAPAVAGSSSGAASTGTKPAAPQGRVPVNTRSLVITAARTIQVGKVAEAEPKVRDIARTHSGEVSGENSSLGDSHEGDGTARSNLVLRVPNAAVDDVEAQLDALGTRLTASRSTVDVTEDVVDVASRVSNAKRSVARVQVLLDKATSISDIVRIEGELASRESDLDSLTARQRALAGTTAMATVNVTLVERAPKAVVPAKHRDGFVGGLESGWRAFGATVATVLLVVGTLLPFAMAAALIGLLTLLVMRAQRASRSAREARTRAGHEAA